ncbi:hypothetical protein TCELL_0818 [Thermogladius calderae 1633]|uniref:GIY-YIG nuclease family protein n=1 Tax=Thermogladius calderae (strain DSM 22663 / VKM B-2946 / 1633) TaxID=1184251 RepID=I3TEQ4_THEC1|nr:DUF123 domain-containing protein [Thermogladius calderae]AFK51242.1 hypothetical protein TCELL_0818 [Thermogladius calderae 1633]
MKGLYVLVLALGEDLRVVTRGGRVFDLPRGVYFYVGSARGPGGVESRVRRHISKSKRLFWHIDYVTSNPGARVLGYFAVTGKGIREYVLSTLLSEVFEPVKGFGSSDDPAAVSHMFRCQWSIPECLERVSRTLGGLGVTVKFIRAP